MVVQLAPGSFLRHIPLETRTSIKELRLPWNHHAGGRALWGDHIHMERALKCSSHSSLGGFASFLPWYQTREWGRLGGDTIPRPCLIVAAKLTVRENHPAEPSPTPLSQVVTVKWLLWSLERFLCSSNRNNGKCPRRYSQRMAQPLCELGKLAQEPQTYPVK